jgi:hypothetical protein
VDLSDRVGSAAEFLRWLIDGDRKGVLSVGQTVPEPYERSFDLSKRGALKEAATVAAMLGLRMRLPVYLNDSSVSPANVARAHTIACRFEHHRAADLRKLDPRPDLAVALGDLSWALWGRSTPLGGEQMGDLQRELRNDLGGDPNWSASASSFLPIPGVIYEVEGEEVAAVEWKVGKR